MNRIIAPSDEYECSSCHIDNVELHECEPPLFTRHKDKFYFCDFCYETFAGNAAEYPDQYDNGQVMQHICAVANILLRKLTEAKK